MTSRLTDELTYYPTDSWSTFLVVVFALKSRLKVVFLSSPTPLESHGLYERDNTLSPTLSEGAGGFCRIDPYELPLNYFRPGCGARVSFHQEVAVKNTVVPRVRKVAIEDQEHTRNRKSHDGTCPSY